MRNELTQVTFHPVQIQAAQKKGCLYILLYLESVIYPGSLINDVIQLTVCAGRWGCVKSAGCIQIYSSSHILNALVWCVLTGVVSFSCAVCIQHNLEAKHNETSHWKNRRFTRKTVNIICRISFLCNNSKHKLQCMWKAMYSWLCLQQCLNISVFISFFFFIVRSSHVVRLCCDTLSQGYSFIHQWRIN